MRAPFPVDFGAPTGGTPLQIRKLLGNRLHAFIAPVDSLPRRLHDGYTWDSADLSRLAALRAPVVAVRAFEDADGESMIVHCRLPEPGL